MRPFFGAAVATYGETVCMESMESMEYITTTMLLEERERHHALLCIVSSSIIRQA
jgi:hypothetical protein